MDFYANDSLGPWTVNNEVHRPQRQRKPRTIIKKEAPQADQVVSDEQAAHCCSQKPECCRTGDKDVLMSEHKLKFVDNVTEIAENKS